MWQTYFDAVISRCTRTGLRNFLRGISRGQLWRNLAVRRWMCTSIHPEEVADCPVTNAFTVAIRSETHQHVLSVTVTGPQYSACTGCKILSTIHFCPFWDSSVAHMCWFATGMGTKVQTASVAVFLSCERRNRIYDTKPCRLRRSSLCTTFCTNRAWFRFNWPRNCTTSEIPIKRVKLAEASDEHPTTGTEVLFPSANATGFNISEVFGLSALGRNSLHWDCRHEFLSRAKIYQHLVGNKFLFILWSQSSRKLEKKLVQIHNQM